MNLHITIVYLIINNTKLKGSVVELNYTKNGVFVQGQQKIENIMTPTDTSCRELQLSTATSF